jgi:hypothetical protein
MINDYVVNLMHAVTVTRKVYAKMDTPTVPLVTN